MSGVIIDLENWNSRRRHYFEVQSKHWFPRVLPTAGKGRMELQKPPNGSVTWLVNECLPLQPPPRKPYAPPLIMQQICCKINYGNFVVKERVS